MTVRFASRAAFGVALAAGLLSTSMAAGQLADKFADTFADVPQITGRPVLDGIQSPQRTVAKTTPLAVEHDDLFLAQASVTMPRLPAEFYLAEDFLNQTQNGETRLRTGIVQPVDLHTDLDGTWSRLPDGRWVWTLEVSAPDAVGLRVCIDRWDPPAGAQLLVYPTADPGAVQAPVTVDHPAVGGRLWTPTIWDESMRLEYVLPAGFVAVPAEAALRVTGILNCYNGPTGPRTPIGGTPIPGNPIPCHLDVNCDATWQDQDTGVTLYHYVDDFFSGFICTGALMNRSTNDFTPIFGTAWHCGVRDDNVTSMELYWHFETNSCNGTVPNVNTLGRTNGVAVLVNDDTTDWTLVGLDGWSGNPWFYGSDANYLADGTDLVTVHHPRGSFKRITYHEKVDDITSCIPALGSLVTTADGSGEIEPGSSGAPIFDPAGRIRGTGSCANWGCNQSNAATFGRLDAAWDDIEPFIIPPAIVYVDSGWAGPERGTESQPFRTFLKGVFAVPEGSTVFIDTGVYSGATTFDKPMTLRASNATVVIGD